MRAEEELDTGEVYRAMRQRSAEKRAGNREHSAEVLRRAGIAFTTHNNGAHLIVKHGGIRVDFWPGTGKWSSQGGRVDRGVFRLLKFLGVSQ